MVDEVKKEKKKVEEVTEKVEVKEVIITSGYVVSRLNHPVQIRYGKDALMLPPRGKKHFSDLNQVHNLPVTGCYFLKDNK